MDALSYVMQTLHMESRLLFRAELTGAWGFRTAPELRTAVFYYLWRGGGLLEIEGQPPVRLNAGDIVLVPSDCPHVMRDEAATDPVSLDRFLAERTHGEHSCSGHGGTAVMIAGEYRFEHQNACSIINALSPCVTVRAGDESTPWLETILKLVCREITKERPGAQIAITRLLDAFFIEILRVSMAQHSEQGLPCRGNVLRALFDPQISDAVTAIHDHPQRPWTVASLAGLAGMSRTAFATRFTAVAGMPPLAYVTLWRMTAAGNLLRHSTKTLSAIASEIGYDSEAAFSAAFKRETGIAPGAYRRAGEASALTD